MQIASFYAHKAPYDKTAKPASLDVQTSCLRSIKWCLSPTNMMFMGHEEIHLNHIGVVDVGFYLHYMNYFSKRNGFLKFYVYLCRVIDFFLLVLFAALRYRILYYQMSMSNICLKSREFMPIAS